MSASGNLIELFSALDLAQLTNEPGALARLQSFMTERERREFDALLASILWIPNTGPQIEGYFSPAKELYYGGEVGGGKSQLLLGLATTDHYKSIIFRRQLKDAMDLIDESHRLLDGHARFNGNYNVWTRIPGGRRLEFGGVRAAGDEEAYKGRPHDLKGFDEIADFLRRQYKFLTGWLRSPIPGQRTRIVCTGNPPTSPEGAWVIDYWGAWLDLKHPNRALPMELRYYATIDGEEVELPGPEPIEIHGEIEPVTPISRTFIPATLDDNPFYAGSDYRSILNSLPEPLRSRLLHGDYSIGHDDHPWQVIPTKWIMLAMKRHKENPPPAELYLDMVGIDPARGGPARTVLFPRFGAWWDKPVIKPGAETPDGKSVARLLLEMLDRYPLIRGAVDEVVVNIDVIGIGSSPYDSCVEVAQEINDRRDYSGSLGDRPQNRMYRRPRRRLKVNPVNVGISSSWVDGTGRLRARNIKAEILWRLKEELDPEHGSNLMIPDVPQLLADLTSYRWSLTLGGILIEEKPKQSERIGRSPDVGEAFILSAFQHFRPKQEKTSGALARAMRAQRQGRRHIPRR